MRLSLAVLFVLLSFGSLAHAQIPAEILEHPDIDIPQIPGITAPVEKEKKKEINAPFSVTHVKGWVSAAANDIFSFSAENYGERRKANQDYFTDSGFKSFYSVIEKNFLESIKEKQQRVRGYIISPVSVTDPKEVKGVIIWNASFDYVMEYASKSGTSYQFLNVTIGIRNISDENGLKIGIDHWKSSSDPDPVFCVCNTKGNAKQRESLGDKLKRQFDIPEEEQEPADPLAPYEQTIEPHGGSGAEASE